MSILKSLINDFSYRIKRDYIYSACIIIFIFFIDRISKIKIINHQIENNQIYINKFINFDLVWNTGVGFGILSTSSSIIYNIISLIIGIIIIFIMYLVTKSNLIDKMLFSLILGGALGNFYDRLIYFAVPDFIDFHISNFHWFTFNIADIFITIGIIMLIFKDIFLKNEEN